MMTQEQHMYRTEQRSLCYTIEACDTVVMETSKSPKPRHFTDSSRERRDKNRREQGTKSYLKKNKKSEEERLWRNWDVRMEVDVFV